MADTTVMSKSLGVVIVAACAAALALMTASASASTGCALVASPSGSDTAAGSAAAPLRSAQKLVDALQPGETGCLRGGTYVGDVTMRSRSATLTSYPGETARLVGRLWVPGDGDTIRGLELDGRNAANLPSPSINGDDVTFSDDDVTNDHTAICFDIGSHTWGIAHNTVIERNRIHDCGVLPPQNHNHGIYLQAAYDTQIVWNLIYNNADRGIQLYPDAQDTVIAHNVVNDNGEALDISGADGTASSNSDIYDNLLTNSRVRYDVQSWYPSGNPVGRNNRVHNNCIWGGAMGTVETVGGGFTSRQNTVANPRYVDAAAANFALRGQSPCASLAGDIASVVAGTKTVAQATSLRTGRRRPLFTLTLDWRPPRW